MSESVKKLSFENMSFKFKAAYGQYDEKFDKAQSDERKTRLNEAITELYKDKLSYPDFYSAIDDETEDQKKFYRAKINTTRKFAYRRNERKKARIERHK